MSNDGPGCGETAGGCLSLVVLVVVGGALWLFLEARKNDEVNRRDQRRADSTQQARETRIKLRFSTAASAVDTVTRIWQVDSLADPASGLAVPRVAAAWSDHALCRLTVEERIDRTRLAGIDCPGLSVSAYSGVEVKFDDRDASDQMRLEQFSNSEAVYIDSRQAANNLQYDEFLRRITSAGHMALRLNFEVVDERWVRFSLAGSQPALARIGAVRSANPPD
jgi:hypothetical protein